MVSKKDKLRAVGYVAGRIEESRLYQILECGDMGLLLKQHPDRAEDPRSLQVLFPNFFPRVIDYSAALKQNTDERTISVPLYYKDGESAFVRLAERTSWRPDKSLKNYTPMQINQMLFLRDSERIALDHLRNRVLQYYQPPTARLEESLREFSVSEVTLDYSHFSSDERRMRCLPLSRKAVDYVLLDPPDGHTLDGMIQFYIARADCYTFGKLGILREEKVAQLPQNV
jgi:hypothetical protein